MLPNDFLRRKRMSRIYYKDKFFNYPLKLVNALTHMGVYESMRILLSYAKWQLWPHLEEINFEQWVTNRFGGRLFLHFFKAYTEKVWGISCSEIRADWAAQRIKNLSLWRAIWNAISGRNDTTSLIETFEYPRLGPGMMWEAFRDQIQANGGEVRINSNIVRVHRKEDAIVAIEVSANLSSSSSYCFEADHFISSMPLSTLVSIMAPPAPPEIQAAARTLKYRDFLIVALILDRRDPFPDNWIYVHAPEVRVGRIQNFRAWSEDLVPDPLRACIGMEYFCREGDELWSMTNSELIRLAAAELEHLNLARVSDVVDGTVVRETKAYPIYDGQYRSALETIRRWLVRFPNLQVVGRNGMHRYNNQDHSMLTGMLAVENLLGATHDLWSVNVEKEYHERAKPYSRPLKAAHATALTA
jgi:protoporphyrinogen oxidase